MLSFVLSFFLILPLFVRKVDTVDIPSAVMKKEFRAAIVLPESYSSADAIKNKTRFPVLYLLHGGFGHFTDWPTKTSDKTLLHRLADEYNIIIVMPEGETFSYYLDSPVNKKSQFETYITKEVIDKIDNTYRTIPDRRGRVIAGLSMGGYGALHLSALHPELYCAAGGMSAALNPDMHGWILTPGIAKDIKAQFETILGPFDQSPDGWASYSVINMADRMKTNGLKLIFDCGTDDFLIEANRELHRRLTLNQTPHQYAERPGGHTWDYWQASLPNHVLFFSNVLKENGTAVQ